MRNTFAKTLVEIAEKDKNVYLLTGDLGYSLFDEFREKFPEQFVNCGVAEQNMIGVAAGLALEGKEVYVYSIVPFVTMRCFEQIRNDVCYQDLDVNIVGVGAGFAYGSLGSTHHAVEDIAILRTLPNMTIFSPADPIETRKLIYCSYQTSHPTYLRLYRSGEKSLYEKEPEIEIGKPSILREGSDGLIIATGEIVRLALEVVEKLKELNYNFKLISLHTLKPIDKESLLKELEGIDKVFTLEEHDIIGGLGSSVAEIISESDWNGFFERIAVPDKHSSKIGSSDYLRIENKLDADHLIKKILGKIRKKGESC
jgi:transketolase